MVDILLRYLLFLAETLTVAAIVWLLIAMLISISRRRGHVPESLEVRSLNEKFSSMNRVLRREILSRKEFKKSVREEKKRSKGEGSARRRIFVLSFKGDIKATGVASLREEITAILTLATPEDEVLVRLENTGGMVHEHGLAASQLMRLRRKEIPLTICVDKVAASGGYLMACVANRILAAPFAVIGSIGVLAQLPNFHRLLERHGVEFEEARAGEFKRTLSMFGKNTDEERARLRRQLEEIHALFKDLVARHRPQVEMERVATGEYWYGAQALELRLVDEILTSDDYLLAAGASADLYDVGFIARKAVGERIVSVIEHAAERLLLRLRDAGTAAHP